MYTIYFANGPKRYEERVSFPFGDVTISIHQARDGCWLFGLYGEPKSSWQRMVAIDDFVPLGVMRRALRIFDEEMTQARARLALEGSNTKPRRSETARAPRASAA